MTSPPGKPAQPGNLPAPTVDALEHSRRVADFIHADIAAAGGWVPFSRYMELALYAPGLGYYSAGARKLGAEGDFTTAPEMSPLFGQVLARQVQELFLDEGLPRVILEVGAGSGALAASLLEELARLDELPEQYLILELSADLRQRERDTLAARVPALLDRVAWLNQLPPAFSGVIIGNEVLDAMPVELFRVGANGPEQGGVRAANHAADAAASFATPFELAWRPATGALAAAVSSLDVAPLDLAPGYLSEVGIVAGGFIASIAAMLEQGAALFIDYGFPRAEYYHPQRAEGTLMCHYRHRAHDDPFLLPGLQDITAHVDFSAVAAAAHAGGLEVLGYVTQSQFLVNCGITEVLSRVDPSDVRAYLPLASAAQHLLSPAEMGELFKVIALGRGLHEPLTGLLRGDRTDTL